MQILSKNIDSDLSCVTTLDYPVLSLSQACFILCYPLNCKFRYRRTIELNIKFYESRFPISSLNCFSFSTLISNVVPVSH